VVAGVLLVAVGLGSRPAQAHSDIEKSTPAAGSTVTAAPAEISLTFVDAIRGRFSTVVVTGPDGVTYGAGQPRVVDRTVHQPVKPLVSGTYTVAWRVVSGDGHPLQGVYRFTAALPAQPSPSVAPSPASPSPLPADAPATDGASADGAATDGASADGASADGASPSVAASETTSRTFPTGLVVVGAVLVLAVIAVGGVLMRRRRAS
jgi:copper resistance protein C